MYSGKKEIIQLVALLQAHDVKKVVLCPGSRNAPIIHDICETNFFDCYSVTDERSAAYVALGMAIKEKGPVVVCCTSGTALLNMHPAVAEAFYQHIPLIIISADRPQAWIGQMDGQTLPQTNVYGSLVKQSVTLPIIQSEEDEWFANRLINEALLSAVHHVHGPVHINVPLAEPLFEASLPTLPNVRVIRRISYDEALYAKEKYRKLIAQFQQRIIIVGQQLPNATWPSLYSSTLDTAYVWLIENLGNYACPVEGIYNFDWLVYLLNQEDKPTFAPDLIITYGGHLISKRLKLFLRQYKPKAHWHIAEDGSVVDTFGVLTKVFEMSPLVFIKEIATGIPLSGTNYVNTWKNRAKAINIPPLHYSGIRAVAELIERIPQECVIHAANSSSVRYLQLFKLPEKVNICCNRGTNGIEGSISTAVGYAATSELLNIIITGDLSFFYDMNILREQMISSNLRILLINNGGGEIFYGVKGLKMQYDSARFISATHREEAVNWVKSKFEYLAVSNEDELENAMEQLTQAYSERPIFVEVFVSAQVDTEEMKRITNIINKNINIKD